MRGEAARPGKRPLRSLSAAEKMDAIQRVHEGESKASVARDIGVPESTLRGWCKSEHKIRDMARRSSSTPDSDPHSPASSSGANALLGLPGASNHSSEDEAAVGGPIPKRMKLESSMSAAAAAADGAAHDGLAESLKLHDGAKQQQQQQQQQQSKMDYVNSLLSSIVAGGVRPENHALLMQQLGLLQTATSAANLTKNLLNLTGGGLGASGHLASSSQAVGLVENGLQYSKSSAGSSGSHAGKRNSLGASIVSAIAPSSQLDPSKQDARKSLPSTTLLPSAAEAPSTPSPVSPRKNGDAHSGVPAAHQQPLSSLGSTRSSSAKQREALGGSAAAASRKNDEALWLWLAQQQQQQLLGHQAAGLPFNPSSSVDGSWFWQWYKQCSFPMVAQTALAQPSGTQASALAQARKSPSKAKAMLDNVLCNNGVSSSSGGAGHNGHGNHNNNNNNNNNNSSSNNSNNNDSVRRCLNLSVNHNGTPEEEADTGSALADEQQPPLNVDDALDGGEKLFRYLDACSIPAVSRLQIIQLRYLLDNIKDSRKSRSVSKRRRK